MGNIAQELSSSEKDIQIKLDRLFDKWVQIISQSIKQSLQKHDLDEDPLAIASYFLAIYEGSLLLSKGKENKTQVVNNLLAFKQFLTYIFRG